MQDAPGRASALPAGWQHVEAEIAELGPLVAQLVVAEDEEAFRALAGHVAPKLRVIEQQCSRAASLAQRVGQGQPAQQQRQQAHLAQQLAAQQQATPLVLREAPGLTHEQRRRLAALYNPRSANGKAQQAKPGAYLQALQAQVNGEPSPHLTAADAGRVVRAATWADHEAALEVVERAQRARQQAEQQAAQQRLEQAELRRQQEAQRQARFDELSAQRMLDLVRGQVQPLMAQYEAQRAPPAGYQAIRLALQRAREQARQRLSTGSRAAFEAKLQQYEELVLAQMNLYRRRAAAAPQRRPPAAPSQESAAAAEAPPPQRPRTGLAALLRSEPANQLTEMVRAALESAVAEQRPARGSSVWAPPASRQRDQQTQQQPLPRAIAHYQQQAAAAAVQLAVGPRRLQPWPEHQQQQQPPEQQQQQQPLEQQQQHQQLPEQHVLGGGQPATAPAQQGTLAAAEQLIARLGRLTAAERAAALAELGMTRDEVKAILLQFTAQQQQQHEGAPPPPQQQPQPQQQQQQQQQAAAGDVALEEVTSEDWDALLATGQAPPVRPPVQACEAAAAAQASPPPRSTTPPVAASPAPILAGQKRSVEVVGPAQPPPPGAKRQAGAAEAQQPPSPAEQQAADRSPPSPDHQQQRQQEHQQQQGGQPAGCESAARAAAGGAAEASSGGKEDSAAAGPAAAWPAAAPPPATAGIVFVDGEDSDSEIIVID